MSRSIFGHFVGFAVFFGGSKLAVYSRMRFVHIASFPFQPTFPQDAMPKTCLQAKKVIPPRPSRTVGAFEVRDESLYLSLVQIAQFLSRQMSQEWFHGGLGERWFQTAKEKLRSGQS